MATKNVTVGDITATVISPSAQTALNAVRYLQRVLCARPALITGRRVNLTGVPEFALILAHVRNPVNFPFEIPDPQAHPEDVAMCWDVYLDSDPLLRAQLFRALDPPPSPRERMDTYWSQALQDFEAMLQSGLTRLRKSG